MVHEGSLYTSARYLAGLVDYVAAQGKDTSTVLAALGVDRAAMLDADCQIPHAVQDLAFAEAERLTGDSNIGLHAGQSAHVVHVGVIGYLALSCRKGGELLDDLVRYQTLIGNALHLRCTRTPSAIYLDYQLQRVPSRHSLEYTLAVQATIARRVAGASFRATVLELMYEEPPDTREQQHFFDCELRFGCARMRATFDPKLDILPLLGGEPGLRDALEHAATQRLGRLQARLADGDHQLARLEDYIAEHLRGGPPSIAQAAQALTTSVRTLQRRLDARGLLYRELVANSRRREVERLLRDPRLSLVDVAHMSGFSEQSAFARAIRRWFDVTPAELRRRLRAKTGA